MLQNSIQPMFCQHARNGRANMVHILAKAWKVSENCCMQLRGIQSRHWLYFAMFYILQFLWALVQTPCHHGKLLFMWKFKVTELVWIKSDLFQIFGLTQTFQTLRSLASCLAKIGSLERLGPCEGCSYGILIEFSLILNKVLKKNHLSSCFSG